MSAFPSQPSLSTPRAPNTPEESALSYKDQVREASENAVPVAAAVPVTESRISYEEKVVLERENLEQQRRILELERQQLEAERQQSNPNTGLSKKQWIYIGAVGAIFLLATAVTGVCTSGNCSGGRSTLADAALDKVLAPVPSPQSNSTTSAPTPSTFMSTRYTAAPSTIAPSTFFPVTAPAKQPLPPYLRPVPQL